MSTTHDQAMHYIYQQVLQRLLDHMTQAQRASVQLLVQRLLVIAGGQEYIGGFRVLVLHGGDRRSSHLLACLRAAQLSIAIRYAATFRLRVLVARLPTLDDATLAMHERCFGALFLHDDSRVELLRADGGQVGPFGARQAGTPRQLSEAGNAWLLYGHLTGARPDALLGARAYLELAASLSQALEVEAGTDALVSAVPLGERHRLLAWGRRCLRHTVEVAHTLAPHCANTLAESLEQLGQVLADPLGPPVPRSSGPSTAALRVVAMEDLLHLAEGERLDRMLGLQQALPCHALGPAGLFDPLPLAHLHGLRAQFLEPRSYRDGAQAFLARLGQQIAWPQGQDLRDEAQARLLGAYGVAEKQLTCLLFTPFEGAGRHLEQFVLRCHPGMRVALPYLHRALRGQPCPEPVSQWLVDTSGLELAQLRAIYAGTLEPQTQSLFRQLARRDLWLRPLVVHQGEGYPALRTAT
ncbi:MULTISPECIES: hypothetical protein [unclassified Pseudomonas]|uniref:hypothetical protein n=1 Tax=unclassified Pseudomonas TaxID=196821 RepID=UPI00244B26B3|nr:MULTISPECIES: hypothetical protein [unclassified Pseudomonas]MDH0303340.1 hypothetical protein [Pseudomonas sp. GD04091]MDH1985364.1 hypothetical protein [Pseudomonas sp. GD03689]